MPQLALDAGVDVLAHTPFTGFAGRAFTAHAVKAGQVWISTLAIHGEDPEAAEFARVNLAGFAAAGGRVLYGTDLGNGDQPLGVNPAELELLAQAGLEASDLISSLTEAWPAAVAAAHHGIATFVPGSPPATLDELPAWLATAHIVPIEDLEQW